MLVKVNDQWYDPEKFDKVMLRFVDKADKEYVIACIQNMEDEENCIAFLPDDSPETEEELRAWMLEE